MQKETVTLIGSTPGTSYQLTALHFGPDNGKKVYMQASIHGDELPGSLVAYYLHQALLKLEQEDRLDARIVLVPFCNPIGLGQMLNYQHIGRFHFAGAQNFNRLIKPHFDLFPKLIDVIEREGIVWSESAADNTKLLRRYLKQMIDDIAVITATDSMHKTLLSWACDADIVLDLHCDNHAVLHMYGCPESWHRLEPLARYLGSECQLLSEDSGSNSFDEVLYSIWPRLRNHFPEVPLELACIGSTVEFRGEYELSHDLASKDAEAIIQYLNHQSYLRLPEERCLDLPAMVREPHPLGGLCYIDAPTSGIAVYLVQPGDWVEAGQAIVDIVDPISLAKTTVRSPADGVVFAHSGQRLARPERKLMSISSPVEQGNSGLSP
ncbi:succinylglutamate desuccinylase/aspartoacylase family protein [Oligella urethralis]|uniref:succinylglutamate desuccinylase/aspartoacylase family protein n=1 Tax=Oligella urethralis TaxID=90245 RepID=UPI000380AD0D|nr:succinylglutamate desuccinylase/aspartoacylase family protein [Oligella urethralis]SUA68543.1 Succinylglutamate desuccinylase / Aspartoacylase family [Oligella urethralis]